MAVAHDGLIASIHRGRPARAESPSAPSSPAAVAADGGERGWSRLPRLAQLYVCGVGALGALAVGTALPSLAGEHWKTVAVLLLLALPASTLTVSFSHNVSTLTICQVLDYLALLLLGPREAVLVAAVGGWAQCTLGSRNRNPLHMTVFSVSTLAIAASAAGGIYVGLGGQPGSWTWSSAEGPFVAATTAFFLFNSGLIAAAIGLSTSQSSIRVWCETFIWTWPGYLLGAGVAAAAVISLNEGRIWPVLFLAIPMIVTFQNLRAYVQQINDAATDGLTELANQRAIFSITTREISRAKRQHTSLGVLLIDVDEFKAINDTYGHLAGDRALQHVARILRHSVHAYDSCGRLAGDEFVVVLADCDRPQAESKAAALQSICESTAFMPKPGVEARLRISVGVGVYPKDGTSTEALIASADASMYRDKFSRRARRAHSRQRS
jgi:diguanylate cyclase (GGDEF)-like protein